MRSASRTPRTTTASAERPVTPLDLALPRPGLADAPMIVLAHGAGGSQADPLLVEARASLIARGYGVVLFDFAYRRAGKRLPPRAPPLIAEWREVITEVTARAPSHPLVIGGKSMGGRMATMLAAEPEPGPIAGLLLLSYPLHPKDQPEKLRAEHLAAIRAPMLFVSGDRDPLCDLRLFRPIVRKLGAQAELAVVKGGDHDLRGKQVAARPDYGALVDAWWRRHV